MKTQLLAVLALFTVLVGCSSQEPTPEQTALNNLKWNYAENAVQLNFTSSAGLNQYDGQAHNLLVVVVQFDQPNAFANYTGSSQQLSTLLLSDTAPAGLIGLTRLFIEPGESKSITIPRLEGAKMIGVAAGYAHLDPARSAKLYQIGVDVTSTGFFSKTWTAQPQPIAIDLLLGADALLRGKDSKLSLPVPVQPKAGEMNLPGAQL